MNQDDLETSVPCPACHRRPGCPWCHGVGAVSTELRTRWRLGLGPPSNDIDPPPEAA